MAEEYDNELRGVLFKVPEDKRTDKGPVMRGTCQIEGVDYRMSVWANKSQKGTRYWSIRFQVDDGEHSSKKKSGKPSNSEKERSQAPLDDRDQDDIPF